MHTEYYLRHKKHIQKHIRARIQQILINARNILIANYQCILKQQQRMRM